MTTLTGIALVPGGAAGAALVLGAASDVAVRRDAGGDPREQLAAARRGARDELGAGLESLTDGPARQILRAQIALLDDPLLIQEMHAGIDRGLHALDAVTGAAASLSARFAALGDPALRARAADLRDVCDCVARRLAAETLPHPPTERRIVCATELSPAQVLGFIERRPLAIVLETSVAASHAAILVRALGVPAVIGVPRITALVRDGDPVAVDGTGGQVALDPEAPAFAAPQSAAPAASFERDAERVRTEDGAAVAITATVLDAPDARRALAAGADGIGLFRTEWLFVQSDTLPSEEAQYEAYRQVAALSEGHPVTMRTFDLGSDKRPPALRLPHERNPALGLRGIRLAFAYPDLMTTQFRALFRAFERRPFRLLLPMVNDADDVGRMRELIARAGAPQGGFELGVMIETPAAALMARELAALVDFLSLGTNDLTQYVLAADRENESMTSVYAPLHPAVLRLVRQVLDAAEQAGKPVAVCGEAASDPLAAPLLVGMGISELSVPCAAVGRIKRLIRRMSARRERALGEELMALPTAGAVTARLDEVRRAAGAECTRES